MPPPHTNDAYFDALEAELLRLLSESDGGLNEVSLFNALDDQGIAGFSRSEREGDLALFRRHFLLFHVLYRLRDRLRSEQRAELEIHTLKSRLLPYHAGERALAVGHDALRDYYLDLDNLHDTDEEELQALIGEFWEKMNALDHREKALRVLGLEGDEPFEAVKGRYRRLAARHHPDRGGDPHHFREIRSAFEALSRLEGKNRS